MFKFRFKLANMNKLKLYPVSRPNSLLGQINQYSHKSHTKYYKQDYLKKSCTLASSETLKCKGTSDSH